MCGLFCDGVNGKSAAAPSCSVSLLDTDNRIDLLADLSCNVRQRSTQNIHIREGRLAVGCAVSDELRIRRNLTERPTAMDSVQVWNHSPGASHNSTRKVARYVRIGSEAPIGEDIGGKRACVDIERIGQSVYLKCAVGDCPETEGICRKAPVFRSLTVWS